MALANFFDKAALGAAQILQGFDYAAFAAALEGKVIGLVFDDAAARSPEGAVTLTLGTNLLARLYPRLAITGHGRAAGRLALQLADEARSINPAIELAAGLDDIDVALAVGASRITSPMPVIHLGSDGWLAKLSPHEPVGSGWTNNPFGAAAAACFGAANVFRLLFSDQLPQGHGRTDEPFTLSLLDLDPTSVTPANPPLSAIDLGELHIVGLGAIGNGAAWVLARTPDVRGTVHLIDHEPVDLTNLQRYVLTTQTDVTTPKVLVAERAFANGPLTVEPHDRSWSRYLHERSDWHLDRVAVAVDTAADRCAVQAALPRWVVNAWTQPGDLGVSRHGFLGDDACLACLYLPEGDRLHEDEVVAAALGLGDAQREVRTLLATGAPVGADLIARIATAMQVPVEPLLPFAGRPLRAFYSGAVCGGIVLRLGGGGRPGRGAEVPMAFQSALAGILLAAELLADAGGLQAGAPRVTSRINLLAPLGQYLTQRDRKRPGGRCICQDEDYITAYRAKYRA